MLQQSGAPAWCTRVDTCLQQILTVLDRRHLISKAKAEHETESQRVAPSAHCAAAQQHSTIVFVIFCLAKQRTGDRRRRSGWLHPRMVVVH